MEMWMVWSYERVLRLLEWLGSLLSRPMTAATLRRLDTGPDFGFYACVW